MLNIMNSSMKLCTFALLLGKLSVGEPTAEAAQDAFLSSSTFLKRSELYSVQWRQANVFDELRKPDTNVKNVLQKDTLEFGQYSSWWHVELSVESKLSNPIEVADQKSAILTAETMSPLGTKSIILNGTVLSTSVYRREPNLHAYEAIGLNATEYGKVVEQAVDRGLTQTFATTFTNENDQQLFSTGFIYVYDSSFVQNVKCISLKQLAAEFTQNRAMWSAKSLSFVSETTSTDDPVACMMVTLYDSAGLETQVMSPKLHTLDESVLAVEQGNYRVLTMAGITLNSTAMFASVLKPVTDVDKMYYQSKFNLTLSETQQELHNLAATGFAPYEVTPFVTSQGEIRYNVFSEYFGEEFQNRGPNNNNSPDEFKCFDEQVSEYMHKNGIPGGSVSVMAGGKIFHSQAYGLRQVRYLNDRDQFPPNELQDFFVTKDTRFRIASISKFITAQTVLQFAAAGYLDLDIPLFAPKHGPLTLFTQRHDEFGFEPFSSIKSEFMANNATTRDLLRHRSGWLTDSLFNPTIPYKTCRGILWYDLQTQPQAYTPGPEFEAASHPYTGYLNLHYCMLEEVLKSVARATSLSADSATPLKQRDGSTGPINFETDGTPVVEMEYIEVVRKVLLEPASVTDSEIASKVQLGKTRYQTNNTQESEYYCSRCFHLPVQNAETGEIEVLETTYGSAFDGRDIQGAGGWTATTEGLLKLLRATVPAQCSDYIRNEDDSLSSMKCLVSKQMFESMIQKPTSVPTDETTWLGLAVFVQQGSVFHSGSLPGTTSELSIVNRHKTIEGADVSYAVVFNTRNIALVKEMVETALDCVPQLSLPETKPEPEKVNADKLDIVAIIVGAVCGAVFVFGMLFVAIRKRSTEEEDSLHQFNV